MSFIKFALIGTLGFGVDALSFIAFSTFMAHEYARVLAFWIAASSNWWFNKHWTFKPSETDPVSIPPPLRLNTREWAKFMVSSGISFLPNMASYLTVLSVFPAIKEFPVLSLVPGILVGMVFNYGFSKYWVFRTD